MKNDKAFFRWKLTDIIAILGFFIFSSIISLLIDHNFNISQNIRGYINSLSFLFLCFWWIYTNNNFNLDYLGLNKEKLKLNYLYLGIIAALIYKLFQLLILIFLVGNIVDSRLDFSNLLSIKFLIGMLIFPFTPFGFLLLILRPITEEILFRGFLYIYLNEKIGILAALLIQAVLFSAFHKEAYNNMWSFINFLFIGIILGVLYEKTKSLYSAIICHSILNFSVLFIAKINIV